MIEFDLEKEAKAEETKPITSIEVPNTYWDDARRYPILDIEAAKVRFEPYLEKIDGMWAEASALTVNNDTQNEYAVTLGTSSKQLCKKIEDVRKEIIEEPNEYVKSVNAFAKIFTEKLQVIESLMKQKIAQYRAVQEQKRREAELAAKKAADELQKQLNAQAKALGTEPVQVATPIIPIGPPVTRTETGAAHGRKAWTFEVENEPEIPREYLEVSTKKINDAIRGGIRQIAGIKIYQKDTTTFRT